MIAEVGTEYNLRQNIMDTITFTVQGEPVGKERMTQKSTWTKKAQRCLAYQAHVAASMIRFVSLADLKAMCRNPADYFRVDILVCLSGVKNNDITCVDCGRKWTNQREIPVCPDCKTEGTIEMILPRSRGDKDNYEKAVLDGIQYGFTKLGLKWNDKQVIKGDTEIMWTERGECVIVRVDNWKVRK